jgi:hypothetical protein
MASSITNNVKRRRVTINSIVPNDMEKMFSTLANSDFLMKSIFLTRQLVQNIVIKYVESAKIEQPFTNSCETTCWWKKFIKFVESTNNSLKMHPEWMKLLNDDNDDVSTVLDSDEETVIETENVTPPLPNVTPPLPNVTPPLPNVTLPLPNVTQTLPNVTLPVPKVIQTIPNVIKTVEIPTLKRSLSKMENFSDDEDSCVYNSINSAFKVRFEEKFKKLFNEQQIKKPGPKIQVRLPSKPLIVQPQQQTVQPQQQTVQPQQQTVQPQQQTVQPQQQTVQPRQQTVQPQQQTILPQSFSNTFFVDFCRYNFDCINEQCKRKHSPGVIPSRFNKMCRDGIYCKYMKCSYKH